MSRNVHSNTTLMAGLLLAAVLFATPAGAATAGSPTFYLTDRSGKFTIQMQPRGQASLPTLQNRM